MRFKIVIEVECSLCGDKGVGTAEVGTGYASRCLVRSDVLVLEGDPEIPNWQRWSQRRWRGPLCPKCKDPA